MYSVVCPDVVPSFFLHFMRRIRRCSPPPLFFFIARFPRTFADGQWRTTSRGPERCFGKRRVGELLWVSGLLSRLAVQGAYCGRPLFYPVKFRATIAALCTTSQLERPAKNQKERKRNEKRRYTCCAEVAAETTFLSEVQEELQPMRLCS